MTASKQSEPPFEAIASDFLRPSNALLRYWSTSPENPTCWGLSEVADDLDRLTAEVAELRRALAEICDGTKVMGELTRTDMQRLAHAALGEQP